MNHTLQFGIPSLDELFGRAETSAEAANSYGYGAYGIRLNEGRSTSMCFIGPDGTGKSVFGLHLAAQYMADAEIDRLYPKQGEQHLWRPRTLYVSTDLKHQVAGVMWKHFGLEKPNRREFPFHNGCRLGRPNPERPVELLRLDPSDIRLEGTPGAAQVHFIDLVSKTMGDDWGFMNRLLAVLPTPPKRFAQHLLIIDAVEGFETLVGEKDAFGETTSRRARIAQIMRTAGEKCHVCFILEEPRQDERFPEEFVTDVVVRLRSVTIKNYARRTLEIIKTRGQSHVRGQHPFVIRSGAGSTTGRQENADDPEVGKSYVHVFPSLHYLSREEMKARGAPNPGRRDDRVASFGITYLDEMLARLGNKYLTTDFPVGLDDQGLPVQTTTALIGEIATQKTSLATAFLARTFRAFIFRLGDIIRELEGRRPPTLIHEALHAHARSKEIIRGMPEPPALNAMIEKLVQCIVKRQHTKLTKGLTTLQLTFSPDLNLAHDTWRVRFAAWLAEALPDSGAVVLVTTSDQDNHRLADELDGWLQNSKDKALQDWPKNELPLTRDHYSATFREVVKQHLKGRTICRRLELHDLSSPILFQIVQRSVERAQQAVFLSDGLPRNEDRLPYQRNPRFRRSWSIRVVIDDLSTLKDTYPDIGSDPLFLPFLLSYLELEGVTSLIIDSQNGRPDSQVVDAFDRELRALVPHKLLTWRVPFFGGIRDAITVVPPFPSGLPSRVREVRWESKGSSNALIVDPELELYSGLEKGEPKQIPLEVRLYAETPAVAEYIRQENEIFSELFMPIHKAALENQVIIGVGSGQYGILRDLCNVQTNVLLNHTMIFQVDEFWASNRLAVGTIAQLPRGPISRREGILYPVGQYLTEPTSFVLQSDEIVADRVADPFGLFQGGPAVASTGVPDKGPWTRNHYFTLSSQGRPVNLEPSEIAKIDRIPYTWDFGFLLCPASMWNLASGVKLGLGNTTVGEVWSRLPNVLTRKQQPYVSWRSFLGACKAVALAQSARTTQSVRVLDLSTVSEQSFSCLVLEIWASEIFDVIAPDKRPTFMNMLSRINWSAPGTEGLIDWLSDREYLLAFYKTWLLLVDTVALSDMVDRDAIARVKSLEAKGGAVATRHWYKTACGNQHCPVTGELSLPVRMPGHFSVRGDWFLAVSGGSRSERLARRALDLFSSRRANFRRMELGIGLPTRDISSRGMFDSLATALVVAEDKGGRTRAITYGEFVGAAVLQMAGRNADKRRYVYRDQAAMPNTP